MINNLESYNKAQLIDIVKTQIEEYQKLDKQNASLKKFVNFQSEVVANADIEIAELEKEVMRLNSIISCDQFKTPTTEKNKRLEAELRVEKKRNAELEKESSHFELAFLEESSLNDLLRIDNDNLKKKNINLMTPDSSQAKQLRAEVQP